MKVKGPPVGSAWALASNFEQRDELQASGLAALLGYTAFAMRLQCVCGTPSHSTCAVSCACPGEETRLSSHPDLVGALDDFGFIPSVVPCDVAYLQGCPELGHLLRPQCSMHFFKISIHFFTPRAARKVTNLRDLLRKLLHHKPWHWPRA